MAMALSVKDFNEQQDILINAVICGIVICAVLLGLLICFLFCTGQDNQIRPCVVRCLFAMWHFICCKSRRLEHAHATNSAFEMEMEDFSSQSIMTV